MNFLVKLEDLVNKFLILLQELVAKYIPKPIKALWASIAAFWTGLLTFIKSIPSKLKEFIPKALAFLKAQVSSFDFKAKLMGSYQAAMEKHKQHSEGKKTGAFKKAMLTPFLLLGQWLQGLSPAQSLGLMALTGLSLLSIIGIGFSGHRLVSQHIDANRAPASVEPEVAYERPNYYKKQTRFLEVTNIRLPVHFVQVNEIRSVDLDFTATLSNRKSKMILEKLEFQLRDHLVLTIEPVVSSFPLEDEGKEIIRQKIQNEINDFMAANKIEGEVQELKLTYVLAN